MIIIVNHLLVVVQRYEMKLRKLDTAINFAVSNRDRSIIASLAEREGISLGQAARKLLGEGIRARGLD